MAEVERLRSPSHDRIRLIHTNSSTSWRFSEECPQSDDEPRKQAFFLIFDMKQSCMSINAPKRMLLFVDEDFATTFQTEKDLIHKKVTGPNAPDILILAADKNDKFLLIQQDTYTKLMVCMRNRNDLTQRDIINSVLHFLKQPLLDVKPYCLLANNNRINDEVPALPNMSLVRIVNIKTLTIQIIYQYELFREKRFTFRCENVDSLAKLKEIFLVELYSEGSTPENVNSSIVWLTDEEKVLSDGLLLDILAEKLREKNLAREQTLKEYFSQEHMHRYSPASHYTSLGVHGSEHLCFELYAYFQPADAVIARVKFPGASRMAMLERPIVISSNISLLNFRQEVAKVVQQLPAAIRIMLMDKKLDENMDLQQALCVPNCVITVDIKQKIMIDIDVKFSDGRKTQTLSILLYSNDFGYCLLSKLCQKIHCKSHYIDLFFEGRPVAENKTLSENRIRNKDKVQAIVFKNRVFASVRTTKKHWIDLVIDDCCLTTVKDLKMFVQGLDNTHNPAHDCEIMVIFQHKVLEDHLTFKGAGIKGPAIQSQSQDMNEQFSMISHCPVIHKIVLVQIESRCFTAASSCNGQLAVFRDFEGKYFQYVGAIVGGKKFFYDPNESPEYVLAEVESMLVGRRKTRSNIKGIKLCSEYQKQMLMKSQSCKRMVLQNRLQLQSMSTFLQEVGCQCTLTSNVLPSESEASVCKGIENNSSLSKGEIKEIKRVCTSDENQPQQIACLDSTTLDTVEKKSALWNTTEIVCTGSSSVKTQEQVQAVCTDLKEMSEKGLYSSQDHTKHSLVPSSRSDTFLKAMPKRPRKRKLKRTHSRSTYKVQEHSEVQNITQGSTSEFSSDNETGCTKRIVIKKTYESLTESEDGRFIEEKKNYSRTILSADDIRLNYFPSTTQDKRVTYCHSSEFTYKYIKKRIIMEIASNLRLNNMNVIRELNISEITIEQAHVMHPNNLMEKYLYCLHAWCQQFGDKANKDTLIAALQRCERNDLVERVHELDKSESC